MAKHESIQLGMAIIITSQCWANHGSITDQQSPISIDDNIAHSVASQ